VNDTGKSLLIGASGQVGRQILKFLSGNEVLLSSRSISSQADVVLDLAKLTSVAEVRQILADRSLKAIYCVGGMTNVEACEDYPQLAHQVNCTAPAVLAAFAEEHSIPLIYFSTEYVFDGNGGSYREDAAANPISAYGRSKWEGERLVLAACRRSLVLRTTVVFGEDQGEKNYAYSVLRALTDGSRMRVPADQISTPTYNKDLALATVSLVQRNETGVFHLCGPQRMGRLEFAQKVARQFRLDETLLEGVATATLDQKAPRPLSAGLAINKLSERHPDLVMHTVEQGLDDSHAAFEMFIKSHRVARS
jgi:dTDP-4-dehydrorhamnose reductase